MKRLTPRDAAPMTTRPASRAMAAPADVSAYLAAWIAREAAAYLDLLRTIDRAPRPAFTARAT
jgi:hypothetical protein